MIRFDSRAYFWEQNERKFYSWAEKIGWTVKKKIDAHYDEDYGHYVHYDENTKISIEIKRTRS